MLIGVFHEIEQSAGRNEKEGEEAEESAEWIEYHLNKNRNEIIDVLTTNIRKVNDLVGRQRSDWLAVNSSVYY